MLKGLYLHGCRALASLGHNISEPLSRQQHNYVTNYVKETCQPTSKYTYTYIVEYLYYKIPAQLFV